MFISSYPQEFSGIATPKNSYSQLFLFQRHFSEFSYILKEIRTKEKFCRQPVIRNFKSFVVLCGIVSFDKTEVASWKCFVKKGVLKTFPKLTGKYLFQNLFIIKVAESGRQFY